LELSSGSLRLIESNPCGLAWFSICSNLGKGGSL